MTDEQFNALWSLEDVPACPRGMELLKLFAETYPTIYQFVRPEDFLDLHNEAFSGMPEWESFAAHCENCPDCNES